MKRKTIYIVVAALLFLTNPTQTDFQGYLRTKGINAKGTNGGRSAYFLIGSIYELHGDKYLAVFKNFFKYHDFSDEVDKIQLKNEEEKRKLLPADDHEQ